LVACLKPYLLHQLTERMVSLANLEQRAEYFENYCLYQAGTYTVKGEPPPNVRGRTSFF
jgi:hypothetical protein